MNHIAGLLQLEWSHPWWMLVALQPLSVALVLFLRRRQVMHYADANLLAWVVRGNLQPNKEIRKRLPNIAAWFLLACALAGPRLPLVVNDGKQAATRHDLDVMVILDVSPSMLAEDISPQRLQRAKLELLDLLPRLHGERLGLIAFSGGAGLLMPLNRDYAALRYYLHMAEPALFDVPGTALASALDLASRKLQGGQARKSAILLLTDAEGSALSGAAGAAVLESASKLGSAGIPLFILAVGTQQGATIPLGNGSFVVDEGVEVVSRLDKSGFTEFARKTGGKFAGVEDGDADWRSLYDNGLLTLAANSQDAESVQAWQELYALFLLPAFILFSLQLYPFPFKSRRAIATVLFVILTASIAGYAVPDAAASEIEAYAAYRNNNPLLAQRLYADVQGYAARMGEGASAYRRKDYQYAIKQFGTALLQAHTVEQREQALFNLGNSYFLAGGYRAAADAFLGVLRYAPDNANARANLALAAGKLAETAKPVKSSQGILGRRGRDTGGDLGDDASDQSLSMDTPAETKIPRPGTDYAELEKANLSEAAWRALSFAKSAQGDREIAYRAALKKLELISDQPLALQKTLIKIEAAREYVPKPELQPW